MPVWECFAVMRWVLGLGQLHRQTDSPKHNWSELETVVGVKKPEELRVLASWDIRPHRNSADMFLARCWAELSARREIGDQTEEDIAKAVEARESIIEEGYTGDYIVGAMTISELLNPALWHFTVKAYNRWHTLALMVDITSGDKPASELRNLFARFFAPPKAVEPVAPDEEVSSSG